MTALTVVTTCKSRIEHLRQSLPLMASQQDVECVVVDYDSPGGEVHAWVADHFPAVRVVDVGDAPSFNGSHAKNLGAAAAESPWLAFVDADILLAPTFSTALLPALSGQFYYRPTHVTPDTWGICVVSAQGFSAIGGYDETISAWGCDDDDLYFRLRLLQGCQQQSFDAALIQGAIKHSDESRVRDPRDGERWLSQRANSLYLHIKYDLMRMSGQRELARELRARIYEEVHRTVAADNRNGATTTRVTISLPAAAPEVPLWGWELKRTWVFELTKIPGLPISPFAEAL